MSNVLIIKHGSLGDIVQISGVLRDIKEEHRDKKIFILTTRPYVNLLSRCPFVDGVLIDKRFPRWNLFYLFKLKKLIRKYNFLNVYDLQNSSRTYFYKKYLFNYQKWNSSRDVISKIGKKKYFKTESVLERFKKQLEIESIKVNYSLKPDFSWACENIDQIVNKYFGKKFILIFPFSSPKLSHKQWPYYQQLINIIKKNHNIEVALSPDFNEMDAAKKLEATIITNNQKPLNLSELAGLIKKSSLVISNDTGPAHMAAHLQKEGIVLFGYHTSAKKVSIETDKFKAITVIDLKNLSVEDVYSEVKRKLDSIIG